MVLDQSRMKHMLEFWKKQQESQPELTVTELIKLSTTDDNEVELLVDHDRTLMEMMRRLQDKTQLQEIADPQHSSKGPYGLTNGEASAGWCTWRSWA